MSDIPYNPRQGKKLVEEMQKIDKSDFPFSGNLTRKQSESEEITIPDISPIAKTFPDSPTVLKTFYHSDQQTDLKVADETLWVQHGAPNFMLQMESQRDMHNAQRECKLLGSRPPSDRYAYSPINHTGSVMKTPSTPGQCASFAALLSTHICVGSGGAGGGSRASHHLHAAPTAGEDRPFTKEHISDTLERLWDSGAPENEIYVMMMSPSIYAQAISLVGVRLPTMHQSSRIDAQASSMIASFGMTFICGSVIFKMNRYMPPNCFYLINRKYLELSSIVMNKLDKIEKRGDSEEFTLRSKYTLLCTKETTQAAVLGLADDSDKKSAVEQGRIPLGVVKHRLVQEGGDSKTPVAGWGRSDWVWEFTEELPCGSQMRYRRNGNFERLGRNGHPAEDSDGHIEFDVPPELWNTFRTFMKYQREEDGRGAGSMSSFSNDRHARMDYILPEIAMRMWAAERGIAWHKVDIDEDANQRTDLFAFWRKKTGGGENILTTGKTAHDD